MCVWRVCALCSVPITPKQSLLSRSASLFHEYLVWLSLPNCRSLPSRLSLSQTWSKLGSALNVAAYYATFIARYLPACLRYTVPLFSPGQTHPTNLPRSSGSTVSTVPSTKRSPSPRPAATYIRATTLRYGGTLPQRLSSPCTLLLQHFGACTVLFGGHYRCRCLVHLGAPCQPVYPNSRILVQPNPKRSFS